MQTEDKSGTKSHYSLRINSEKKKKKPPKHINRFMIKELDRHLRISGFVTIASYSLGPADQHPLCFIFLGKM